MPIRVEVLLATYNSGDYLAPMLNSLAAQTHLPAALLVRDDGSTDATLAVVADFARAAPFPVRVMRPGPHLGPYTAFFALLAAAGDRHLVALADHDDVWLPDKLARAVRALAGRPGPVGYGSSVQVTDDQLRFVGRPAVGRPSFQHALFETISTASTLVLNQPARRLVLDHLPRTVVYPDLWCYQLLSALDRFVYDPAPSLLYRQHDANALGIATSRRMRWQRRLHQAREQGLGLGRQHWAQLHELRAQCGVVLPPGALSELDALLTTRSSRRAALVYAARGTVVRRRRLDAIALRLAIAFQRQDAPLRDGQGVSAGRSD